MWVEDAISGGPEECPTLAGGGSLALRLQFCKVSSQEEAYSEGLLD
jgi:hypothetical protein